MKIKNIKIKFNEGHLEHVNIVYNKKINKKINKKQIKTSPRIISAGVDKENKTEKIELISPKIDDELDILLENIILE